MKVKIQICGKLGTRWTFSRAVMVSVGISKLGLRDLIFVHPGVKINGSCYQVITINWVGCMFVLPNQFVYSLSVKMSLSELLWYNQFERFSHHTRIRPEGGVRPNPTNPPWIRHWELLCNAVKYSVYSEHTPLTQWSQSVFYEFC